MPLKQSSREALCLKYFHHLFHLKDVADCAENTKREAVNAFTTKLMKLIVCSEKKFRVRMEVSV